MAFNRKNYPSYWKQFSEYIRFERAGNHCEKCFAKNGEQVMRGLFVDGITPIYQTVDGEVYNAANGAKLGRFYSYDLDLKRVSKIVLTVAHLDYRGGVCQCKRFFGFKCAKPNHVLALCQSCHLSLDREKHLAVQAKNRAAKKDAARGLFQQI